MPPKRRRPATTPKDLPAKRNGRSTDASPWAGIDFRKHPDRYPIGRGEQGVLTAEPYKSELLPHWRFATPAIARKSAAKLYAMYLAYRHEEDFVGMDLARKFIQMGYTRARRYANHAGGRKYDAAGRELPRQETLDATKVESAEIFRQKWDKIRIDKTYLQLKAKHRARVKA